MIVHYMYKKFITKYDVREYPSVLQSKNLLLIAFEVEILNVVTY